MNGTVAPPAWSRNTAAAPTSGIRGWREANHVSKLCVGLVADDIRASGYPRRRFAVACFAGDAVHRATSARAQRYLGGTISVLQPKRISSLALVSARTVSHAEGQRKMRVGFAASS